MMQSKRMSLIEAITNSVSGVFLGFIANLYVLPSLLGAQVNQQQAIAVVLLFTVLSMVRSYIVRRIFNIWR